LWWPVGRIAPASADATCAAPAGFPSSVELYQSAYRNWAGAIQVPAAQFTTVATYQPRTFGRSDPGCPVLLTHLGRASSPR
jgi:hypothetical protein